MEDAWEEALDLDESDFPPILRPCNLQQRPPSVTTDFSISQFHSPITNQTLNNFKQNDETLVGSSSHSKRPRLQTQSIVPFSNSGNAETLGGSQQPSLLYVQPRSIPGPAGAVLAALQRRGSYIREADSQEEMPVLSTQEYLRKAADDVNGGSSEFDDDFEKPRWIAALEFAERGNGELSGSTTIPLGSIKNCGIQKLPKVVAMIKVLTPNGFGDFMVTLKDPSGTVSASIHRSVVTEGNYGCYLSVGAVLVLQKVSIFAPRTVYYLNITHTNVVKIYPKDFKSLSNTVSGLAAVANSRGIPKTNIGSAYEDSGTVGNFRSESMLEQLEGNNKMKDATSKSLRSIEKQNEPSGATPVFNSSEDINNRAQAACKGGSHPFALRHELQVEANKMTHKTAAIDAESNGANKQMQPLASLSSIPQWTDEQLEELLVED